MKSEINASLFRLPLYTQVVIAVICGTIVGVIFGQEPYIGGLRNEQLGQLGMLVILLLKTLAIPLIFFAVLDAFLTTVLPLRQGTRLILICLINVSVAMAIGLVIMNSWQPGLTWRGHVDELLNLARKRITGTDEATEFYSEIGEATVADYERFRRIRRHMLSIAAD